jgi:DNA-binding MarR family transcriptional regulator
MLNDEFQLELSLSSMLYRANLLLKNNLQKEIKEIGITVEQWTILRELYKQYTNDKKEVFNQSQLSKICCKDQASLTRILDILERKRFIKRDKMPEDRRKFLIILTDEGKDIVEKVIPITIDIVKKLDSIFTAEEMITLKDLLNRLIKTMD